MKDLDRTNPGCSQEDSGSESQDLQAFGFPHGDRVVFNGEFDSGSERTLAAWIRHASRARFFLVAIQGKV